MPSKLKKTSYRHVGALAALLISAGLALPSFAADSGASNATPTATASPAAPAQPPAAAPNNSAPPTVVVPAISPTANAPATPAPATSPNDTINIPVPSSGHPKSHRPAAAVLPAVHPFTGEINASHVNIRSGPSINYYPVGQLSRHDLVSVLGTRRGWYAIAAPHGTRCYIARQFVKPNVDGTVGRVTGDYINVRAASVLAPHADFAIVNMLRSGATVHIVGSTSSFYVIKAPPGTRVYVLSKFVAKAAADAQYARPTLVMPAGVSGGQFAAAQPGAAGGGVINMPLSGAAGTTTPVVGAAVPGAATATAPATQVAVSATGAGAGAGSLTPAVNPSLFTQYDQLAQATQKEFDKKLGHENLAPLAVQAKALLAQAGLPASMKKDTTELLAAVNSRMAVQALYKANQTQPSIQQQVQPYQEKWSQSQQQINDIMAREPYVAMGVLRHSSALRSKYALVNPTTDRVTAYVDKTTQIDISKLLGEYIGVKGDFVGKTGTIVPLIKVTTATLMPSPDVQQGPPATH